MLPSWRRTGAAFAHTSARGRGNGYGGGRGRGDGDSGRRKTATRDGESIPQPTGEFLYGIHSVTQALASRHRRVHALSRRLADELQVPVRPVSKWMLNHVTEDKPHQGVVLDVDALKLPVFEPVDAADPSLASPSTSRPVILALDELHDTQNKLLRVKNLHQALARPQTQSPPTSSQPSSSSQPTILVMGNEHRGMRKGIRQCCDDIVTIPGHATESDSRVDSLNVSVAAAILMYELLHH
ncbi:hypothetical protein PINS_up023073 [Pythium insidiosum]|nr:hypothetical protein PINS_up023073 [Pythium insidiosum]